MSGYTKQKRHLKEIREKKKQMHQQNQNESIQQETGKHDEINNDINDIDNSVPKQQKTHKKNGVECAFATLAAGSTYTAANKFSIHMNQAFVSKFTFYNGQQKVLIAVSQYANESMQKYLRLLQYGAIVCGDGRYPIRRNASHCSFDIIDIKTGKIISLGIVDKPSKYHEDETFEGSSNLLESEAMKRAIEYLGEHKSKIAGFIIDGDNKNSKLLQTKDFHPFIYRDPNHLILSFERYLTKELSAVKSMIPGINDCFRGIRMKIEAWYSVLMYSNFDSEVKRFAWRSTVGHLTGDHEMCLPHDECEIAWITGLEHPEVAVKLQEILDKREKDFDLTIYKGTTNLNESFHKEQLIYDDKTVSFPISQEIRDKLALLRHNEGPIFEIDIRKMLNLPELSPQNTQKIISMQYQRENLSETRKTEEFRKDVQLYRKRIAESHKKQSPGDYKRETESESESESESE